MHLGGGGRDGAAISGVLRGDHQLCVGQQSAVCAREGGGHQEAECNHSGR